MRGRGGAYSTGAFICYFDREGGRLFGGRGLSERGRLFEEIQYLTEICQSYDEKNDPDEFYISHNIGCQVPGEYQTIGFTYQNMLFTVFVITIRENKYS